jgi:hypothetical protein
LTRASQAAFLENVVAAIKLQAMLDGAHIETLFSEHVEHVLFRPSGWMSEYHIKEALELDEPSPGASG